MLLVRRRNGLPLFGHTAPLSEKIKANGIVFRETTGDYNYEFHTAPRRQYVVNLEGEVEIEIGDGTRRILRTGDVLLAEDTTGGGHRWTLVDDQPWRRLYVVLQPGAKVPFRKAASEGASA